MGTATAVSISSKHSIYVHKCSLSGVLPLKPHAESVIRREVILFEKKNQSAYYAL